VSYTFALSVLPIFRCGGAARQELTASFVNKNDEKFLQNFFSFYADESRYSGKRIEQNRRKNLLVFQNGPFRIAEWPVLLAKMNHSARRKGPF